MKIIDIIKEVSSELTDEGNDNFKKEHLLTYYNAGVSFVVSARPDCHTKTEDFACVAGAYQEIPASALALIDVVCDKATGQPITTIDRSSLDNRFGNWYSSASLSDSAEMFVYDDRVPREFYLFPAVKAGTVVRAIFSKLPDYAAISDFDNDNTLLPIPLTYLEAIKLYMLYRAYMRDAPTQDIPKASQYLSAVEKMLGIKTQSDSQLSPNKQG